MTTSYRTNAGTSASLGSVYVSWPSNLKRHTLTGESTMLLKFHELWKGYDIVCLYVNDSHHCGYVKVPEDHPFHGLSYDTRLPYEDYKYLLERTPDEDRALPWISMICAGDMETEGIPFDVALDIHGGITFGDKYLEGSPVYQDEHTWWIGFDCAHAGDKTKSWDDGVFRTEEFVRDELHGLVDQLISVNDIAAAAAILNPEG